MSRKRLISIAAICRNEVGNIGELYDRLSTVIESLPAYDFEIIIGDNLSTDGTRDVLRELAKRDKRVKVILNANNFGAVRSGYNTMLRAQGDAVIAISSDMSPPPEIIPSLISAWEGGAHLVCAVRKQGEEHGLMWVLRQIFYSLIARLSETEQIRNFTGTGLYSRKMVEALKRFHDPYPYLRGMVGEIGLSRTEVVFVPEKRKSGKSKHNLFNLYDLAMTGFVNHTKLPLRLAVFSGFVLAGLSLLVALGYFIYKLLNWETFSLGLAPIVIGLFFFSAVQLIFIGILGEYIGAIYTRVQNKPLVIEEELLNFDDN